MHRLSNINSKCNKCSLATGVSVFGQSDCKSNEVVLAIVNSYPGRTEEQLELSLAPDIGKRGRNGDMGAGAYLRLCLKNIFEKDNELPKKYKDIEKYIFFTNIIKCAKRNNTVLRKHRVICRDNWLLPELNLLPPTIPILLAGSDPLKAILGEDKKVSDSRGKIMYFQKHPIIVSMTPIEAERGLLKTFKGDLEVVKQDLDKYFTIIHGKKPNKQIIESLTPIKFWKPLLPGTVNWFFKQDLELVKSEVIKYINNLS